MAAAQSLTQDFVRPWVSAFDSWRSGVEELLARAGSAARPRDACDSACPEDDCQRDDCRCTCCVADSDLVIEARVGERRIVPIIIENKWRRTREIEVQLSDWHCGNSDLQIESRIVDPLKFTIEPCGEHKLLLVVAIEARGSTSDSNRKEGRLSNDVETCVVCYADLRVKGCDVRPMRIAVAVLPCDCEAYRVDCCQACC